MNMNLTALLQAINISINISVDRDQDIFNIISLLTGLATSIRMLPDVISPTL